MVSSHAEIKTEVILTSSKCVPNTQRRGNEVVSRVERKLMGLSDIEGQPCRPRVLGHVDVKLL